MTPSATRDGPPPAAAPARGARDAITLLLLAALLVLTVGPPLAARYPPILDLAQQAAQVRLFDRALEDPDGLYRIQWSGPNKLSYPILAAALAIGGASWGPRLGLIACAALFVAAIVVLGRRFRRPPEHAALAAVFLYSGSYYGGFLNFVVGAAAFAWWLIEQAELPERPDRRAWLRLTLAAVALYLCHALWLAAAGFALLVAGSRRAWRRPVGVGLLALAPFVLATAFWYASLADTRWSAGLRYDSTPWQRLARVELWSTFPLGGLRGPWEPGLELAVLAWALFCLRPSNRRRGDSDRWLARLALGFALLSPLLPDAVGDTAILDHRWAPWAVILGLLALPPPGLPRRWAALAPLVLVVAHTVVTARVWRAFDREEMAGFASALAAVPDGARLLELDFARWSPRFWAPPTYHAAAYAQLDREVTIGYSFAGVPSSLVVFREGDWPWPWTRGLEHHPEQLAPTDLDHFDFVLLHAAEPMQRAIARHTGRLEPVTGAESWRLHRVMPAARAPV